MSDWLKVGGSLQNLIVTIPGPAQGRRRPVVRRAQGRPFPKTSQILVQSTAQVGEVNAARLAQLRRCHRDGHSHPGLHRGSRFSHLFCQLSPLHRVGESSQVRGSPSTS